MGGSFSPQGLIEANLDIRIPILGTSNLGAAKNFLPTIDILCLECKNSIKLSSYHPKID